MKVVWLPAARQDRILIVEYIATDNPAAAAAIDKLFMQAATRLGKFPELGQPGKIAGTRDLIPHKNYRMVYEVHAKTVWVLTLLHTSRQWPPLENEA